MEPWDITDEELYMKEEFQYYADLFKKHIKGKEKVQQLADGIGCSIVSAYSYLGGKIPKKGIAKLFQEIGMKILSELSVPVMLFEDHIKFQKEMSSES